MSQTHTLESNARAMGLGDSQIERLSAYLALLEKWNKVYNLTALRDNTLMLTHHVFDSLSALPALTRHLQGPGPHQVLDVGSGAGLPGIIWAIALPQLSVTCIDTVGKKASFIQQVSAQLKLSELKAVHARVEEWQSPQPFDLITSRAFASLVDFTQLSRHHLAPQGVWLAMKGKTPEEEIQALPDHTEVFHVEPLEVTGLSADRCLIWMRPRKPD